MLIGDLVEFCDTQYQRNQCETCVHGDVCKKDCMYCLDDIHRHIHSIRTDYDCEHLLDYYVCRYSYKYCSEILYVLERINFSKYPFFNILSLGCGGAPDLMAFELREYPQEIIYNGYDKNAYWEKIHNEIEMNFANGEAHFHRGVDVLHFFEDEKIYGCNVIIIEYLISFFYRLVGDDGIREWFSQLANQVIRYKPNNSPVLIVINDADSINLGRDTFQSLKPIIESIGFTVSFERKMRFKNHPNYEGSTMYQSNANRFDIPFRFREDYKVAIKCESAQLVLEVEE